MLRDLRLGLRMLLQSKGWTAVVLLSLALGIGVNTTLFSAVNSLLLKTIWAPEPHDLVRLLWMGDNQMATSRSEYGYIKPSRSGQRIRATFSFFIYAQLRDSNQTMTDLLACAPMGRANLVVKGQAELASAFLSSGNYFEVLGVPAHIGRTILEEDDRADAPPVAMISHSYWQRRFGSDPEVVGLDILVNGTTLTIIGVTPPEYVGIQGLGEDPPDIHLPLVLDQQLNNRDRLSQPTWWWLQMVGRLKPGISSAQVKGNLGGVFQQAAQAGFESFYSELTDEQRTLSRNQGRTAVPELDVASAMRGVYDQPSNTSRLISILSVVVLIVLLIVCANVANLLLSRAALRQREISIRLSMGATRFRLVRQLLTESLILSGMGAGLGLLVAFWSRQLLPTENSPPLDWRVCAFTAGVGVLTGLIFGIIPALRATKVDMASSAKENSRSVSHSRTLLGKSLLVAQVAMSLVLLIGAGLFVRTLQNLRNVKVGFNTRNLLLVSVDAGVNQYDEDRTEGLFGEMQEAFQAIPGVRAVSLSATALLSGSTWINTVHVDQGESTEGQSAHMMTVSPEFLETLEIPVLVGRGLTRQDNRDSPQVALINQTAARDFFGEESPLGRRFGFSPEDRKELEVVGVIGDTKYSNIRDEAPPTVFRPYLQNSFSSVTFELRTGLEARSLVPQVREAVRRIDPKLPLRNVSTQAEEVEERFAQERFVSQAFSLFGVLALVLACIGLFGLMSYSVVRRTNEIGIRMALGAEPWKVIWMVLRESKLLVLIGSIVGLAGSLAAGRFIASLLYELAPTDPMSIAGALLLMVLVSGLAGYLPARRASRVDPMVALHYE